MGRVIVNNARLVRSTIFLAIRSIARETHAQGRTHNKRSMMSASAQANKSTHEAAEHLGYLDSCVTRLVGERNSEEKMLPKDI